MTSISSPRFSLSWERSHHPRSMTHGGLGGAWVWIPKAWYKEDKVQTHVWSPGPRTESQIYPPPNKFTNRTNQLYEEGLFVLDDFQWYQIKSKSFISARTYPWKLNVNLMMFLKGYEELDNLRNNMMSKNKHLNRSMQEKVPKITPSSVNSIYVAKGLGALNGSHPASHTCLSRHLLIELVHFHKTTPPPHWPVRGT